MTIAEFLLARIAEDEAVATAATKGPWTVQRGPAYRIEVGRQEYANDPECLTFAVGDDPDWFSDAEHMARFNPARVLAECAAKRAIVGSLDLTMCPCSRSERCVFHDSSAGPMSFARERYFSVATEVALKSLAAVYADHPDYDPEWGLVL